MRILTVDDDAMTHELVTAVIRVLGDHHVEQAFDAVTALALARQATPDLIISDINMPEMDGLTFTERLREEPALANVPILLLTARSRTQDKYEGFLRGADDYMVKPFDVMELQLRIKALLRRAPSVQGARPASEAPVVVGPLTLTAARSTITVGGHEIRLTASELAIVKLLVERAEERVTPEELLVGALDYPPGVGSPQTIHSHVRNLRAKLRQAGVESTFLTSSHQGYMLTSV